MQLVSLGVHTASAFWPKLFDNDHPADTLMYLAEIRALGARFDMELRDALLCVKAVEERSRDSPEFAEILESERARVLQIAERNLKLVHSMRAVLAEHTPNK